MTKKRSVRLVLFALAGLASLGLIAGAAPAAAAKKKAKQVTKTATLNQCVSTAQALTEGTVGVANNTPNVVFPVAVPKFKGKPQNGVVTAITSVGVRITHTFDRDLFVNLASPGGKVVPLALGRGGSGDGYGSGETSCRGSLVLFADTFGPAITTPGNAPPTPIVGSFKPEQPLSALVGGPAHGNWVVLANDGASGDSGRLDAVSLNLTYQYKALKKKKKKK
jgi:subtilisin-like proprotein convertase family protein